MGIAIGEGWSIGAGWALEDDSTPSTANKITTEASDPLLTENGNNLITES